jgi:hypothetical protein
MLVGGKTGNTAGFSLFNKISNEGIYIAATKVTKYFYKWGEEGLKSQSSPP